MIGDRIKQARRAAGLSLRALAEQAGVSAMAISKYENHKATPSSKVLLALGRVLRVRVEYFFRQAKVALEEVEYRKYTHLPKRVLAQIKGDVIEQVERFLELEDYLPTRPIEIFRAPGDLPQHIDNYAEIEEVARKVREAWQLGLNPIPELTDTLEERGILVFQSEAIHGDRFDGLAATVDGIPVVVVGAGWPGDRQRFTLAHELGHLMLKGRLSTELGEEQAANRFAGAFLVPASEVRKELGKRRTRLEVRELCVLKKAYGLSMGGWQHRAKDLGILSEAAYRSMVRYFRMRGWHKHEPCDDYPREQPLLFAQLVYRALAEDLIGESKAAELLRMPQADFRAQRNMDRAEPTTADQ